MATEMITLKLDGVFLKEIDQAVKANRYQNRTEFIRNALREKLEEAKLKDAMIQLSHLKGASKKKTSERELENIREKVFKELSKSVK
ncbi:MAG TPA: ribbon-helix-helix domain-containing protein [Candidatus Nanoarchaeia archaeon]|nr:ribbon-helix-helix domain-containing protein [Candidatus Nanoarchaeia archaeon]